MSVLAPAVDATVYPWTPAYHRHMAALDEVLLHNGIRLPDPSPQLIAQAERLGVEIRDTCLDRYGRRGVTHDRNGREYARNNTLGKIGEELLANRYGVHAVWYATGVSDQEDFFAYGRRFDSKVRLGFLTLNEDEIRRLRRILPDYLALIVKRKVATGCPITDTPFVFAGVITPAAFLAVRFRFRERPGGPLLWAVSPAAPDFIVARQFHPEHL